MVDLFVCQICCTKLFIHPLASIFLLYDITSLCFVCVCVCVCVHVCVCACMCVYMCMCEYNHVWLIKYNVNLTMVLYCYTSVYVKACRGWYSPSSDFSQNVETNDSYIKCKYTVQICSFPIILVIHKHRGVYEFYKPKAQGYSA